MRSALLERADVPAEERWDDAALFASPEAWDEAYAALEARLGEAGRHRGRLGDPAALADHLDLEEELRLAASRLGVWVSMASSVDANDRGAAERASRHGALAARLAAALAWAEPELVALGAERLRAMAAEEPRLADAGPRIARLERAAPHLRSGEVEELLAELAGPFSGARRAHGVLGNRDLAFGDAEDAHGRPHPISQGTIRTLLASDDATLRRGAWTRYMDAHRAFAPTMAVLMETGVRQTNLLARQRRYPDALEMALEPEGVPVATVDALLDAFRERLGTWHRYFRAKARLLGGERMGPEDVHARMGEVAPEVPFELAVEKMAEAVAPLGDDYVDAMRRGALHERWIDRSVNRGKRMGAFSSGAPGTKPYIMMSYAPDVFGMSTLAHELGHSMHSWLAARNQPPRYARYSLAVAEVASNFHQAALRAHLLAEAGDDPDWELALIEEAMANFYRYLLVMPTLTRFEREIHARSARGEALTETLLTGLMADLLAEAYGDAVDLSGDDGVDRDRLGITWATFHTHLYSRFYAWQYATGIAAANALAARVVEEPSEAARYRRMLEAGGRPDPLDALREAGIDLASPEPIRAGFDVLEGWVERLERRAEASDG